MKKFALNLPSLFITMLLLISGCQKSELPQQNSDGDGIMGSPKNMPGVPEFPGDPNAFVADITNPYLMFTVGRVFQYQAETDEGIETIRVEVTNDTLTILGIAVTIIHDQVFLNDSLIEDTHDWLAQDTAGNVWYFGEDSKEILNGEVISTEGSWKAGVDGALPGIFMLAQPKSGMKYQQELAIDVAEDMAKILGLHRSVEIGLGPFDECLEILEWSPLSPGVYEHKFYKPGVGLILEVHPQGGMERTELVGVN